MLEFSTLEGRDNAVSSSNLMKVPLFMFKFQNYRINRPVDPYRRSRENVYGLYNADVRRKRLEKHEATHLVLQR